MLSWLEPTITSMITLFLKKGKNLPTEKMILSTKGSAMDIRLYLPIFMNMRGKMSQRPI